VDEVNSPDFRFARLVSPTAPKVGHQLATASFQRGEKMTLLWVIEGPQNDGISILGTSTDFAVTRLWSFNFYGSLIERVNQVDLSPYTIGLRLRFTGPDDGPSPLPVQDARVEFSNLRAVNRIDPDSAMVAFSLDAAHGNETVMAAVMNYQRGWLYIIIIILLGLELSRELNPDVLGESAIPLGVEIESGGPGALLRFGGAVAVRPSLVG